MSTLASCASQTAYGRYPPYRLRQFHLHAQAKRRRRLLGQSRTTPSAVPATATARNRFGHLPARLGDPPFELCPLYDATRPARDPRELDNDPKLKVVMENRQAVVEFPAHPEGRLTCPNYPHRPAAPAGRSSARSYHCADNSLKLRRPITLPPGRSATLLSSNTNKRGMPNTRRRTGNLNRNRGARCACGSC